MNRIQNLVEEELYASLSTAVSTAEWIEPAGELENSHCIFTPLHYERNYAYPLIVWLHGPDDDERQVTRIMPLVSMRNYVGVGVRGTVPGNGESYRWSQGQRHIVLAEQRVMSAIAATQAWLNIDPSRIYVAGYGCGGTMAYRIALGQPERFAGVLSIAGAFPTTLRPLAQLHSARKLNIFLASGRDSQECTPEQICSNLRLFHSAGMSVCLRQYPCADDLTTNMLSDMDRWIMEQLNAAQPAFEDQPSDRTRGK